MNGVERGNELESGWQQALLELVAGVPGRARALGRRVGRADRRRGRCRSSRPGEEIATRDAGKTGHAGVQGRRADDDRRRRRPRRVDEDRVRGRRALLGPLGRPQHRVRHSRARDGLDRQRHRRARRLRQAVRLDLPDLQRLHAAGRAPVGADGPARSCGRGRTTRSGSARTARRTSRSRPTPRCARSRTSGSCAPPTRTRPRTRGRSRSSGPTARSRSRSRARRCRRSTAPSSLRPPGSSAAPTRCGSRPPSPELILIATGAEVGLTLEAGRKLAAEGTAVRVVSMPCWELFAEQPSEYRDEVLPPDVRARLSVEPGVELGWSRVGRRPTATRSRSSTSAPRRPAAPSWNSSATTWTTWLRVRTALLERVAA